jgi:hypothetical protein
MATWQHIEDTGAAGLRPGRVRGILQARGDQLLVLVVLFAIWQALSMALGTY